ncbi:putative sporulation protein YtxC [Cytobacillus eiseniae]|uniref:Sporulation protein YtxC n=1 Tax=Cytobacillus eiseniae TaxID=762947 RepID=A0ABS4RJL8_9BACI|nr:putative sporulation protein YtxC [Cytobacillus eiseniae]MBP2243087.1 putative sporulation protein YtxC [Cytobacillus eiseniae]
MIEIIFQKTEDAWGFYQYLQHDPASDTLSDKTILQFEDQHIVRMNIDPNRQKDLEIIQEVFYQFIVKIKQDHWFRRILADQYYFQDEDEQQQILEIIHSILEGNRTDLATFVNDLDVERNLKAAISEIFQERITFSFDSFVKFRMRTLMDQLEKYVEISIDEYKMEQEYQMFIQTLREFLSGKESKLHSIHLLINDGVHFFDEHFYEIKRSDLISMIDRKLLFNHPVYVDSVTIAPLLSIAPLSIYLYSEDDEQPLIRTIHNIFEERLIIGSVSDFYSSKRLFSFIADEKI